MILDIERELNRSYILVRMSLGFFGYQMILKTMTLVRKQKKKKKS